MFLNLTFSSTKLLNIDLSIHQLSLSYPSIPHSASSVSDITTEAHIGEHQLRLELDTRQADISILLSRLGTRIEYFSITE